MSRNFHTLHVHVGASEQAASAREGVIDALCDHLKARNFEPIVRVAGADRVVRISRSRAGWITITDDGHGIDERVFDESVSRGGVLALRRKRAAWKPVHAKGPPRFEIGFGSNQGHGGSHLVFVHRTITLSPTARSLGGAGHGLTVTFGGEMIERGLFVPERVTVEPLGKSAKQWTAEVREQRAFLPDVKIPAGLIEQPDLFTLGRREADRARAIAWAAELRITVTGKAEAEGTGTLRMGVGAGSGDHAELLRALADEAMQGGLGLGALLARYRYAPGLDATAWEQVTMGSSEALRYRAWHAEHVRGLDHDGVWLGPAHLARIDRAGLPGYVEAAPVGPALRLTLPAGRPRRDLAALEEALAPLLPSRSAAEAWESARSPW